MLRTQSAQSMRSEASAASGTGTGTGTGTNISSASGGHGHGKIPIPTIQEEYHRQVEVEKAYQDHQFDMMYIDQWMTEILKLKNDSEPRPASVEFIKAQCQRYDVCFKELLRQTSIYNKDIPRLMMKVWKGVSSLVQRILSDYEFQLVKGRDLEQKIQDVLFSSKHKVFHVEKAMEDMKMDMTLIKAKSIEREATIGQLRNMKVHVDDENERLRHIVHTFIQGKWDTETSLEHVKSKVTATGENVDSDKLSVHQLHSTASEKLHSLNIYDDEINKLFTKSLTEARRQELYLAEIDEIIHQSGYSTICMAQMFEEIGSEGIEISKPGHTDIACQTEKEQVPIFTKDEKTGETIVTEPGMISPTDGSGGGRQSPRSPRDKENMGKKHIPCELRKHMTTFPITMRIPSLNITLNTIFRIFIDKLSYDFLKDTAKLRRDTVPAFTYYYYKNLYGKNAIADMQITQMTLALMHHKGHKRVKLFAKMIGSEDVEKQPLFNLRDTNFIFVILARLRKSGDLSNSVFESMEFKRDSKIFVRRNKAIAAVEYVFGHFLPDSGSGVAHKLQAMPAINNNLIDLDDILDETALQWERINKKWKGHLQFLFRKFSNIYLVAEEVKFATDDDEEDKDCVLVEVPRDKLKRFQIRPARLILLQSQEEKKKRDQKRQETLLKLAGSKQQFVEENGEEEEEESQQQESGVRSSTSLDEVVALIDWKAMKGVLTVLRPDFDDNEKRKFFTEACKLCWEKTEKYFASEWLKGKNAYGEWKYYSKTLKKQQTSKPYDIQNFKSPDVDEDTFLEFMLNHEILTNSPYIKLLDREPVELWEEWETYLQQIQDGTLNSSAPSHLNEVYQLQPDLVLAPIGSIQQAKLIVEQNATNVYSPNAKVRRAIRRRHMIFRKMDGARQKGDENKEQNKIPKLDSTKAPASPSGGRSRNPSMIQKNSPNGRRSNPSMIMNLGSVNKVGGGGSRNPSMIQPKTGGGSGSRNPSMMQKRSTILHRQVSRSLEDAVQSPGRSSSGGRKSIRKSMMMSNRTSIVANIGGEKVAVKRNKSMSKKKSDVRLSKERMSFLNKSGTNLRGSGEH